MSKTYLILDVSNFLYKSFHRTIKDDAELSVGLAQHLTLTSMNYFFKKHKVDEIVAVFDSGKGSWRKKYTKAKDLCVTHQIYKGNRNDKMSPADKEKLEEFKKHIPTFAELFRDMSTTIFLQRDYLEADDLIAGFIQSHPNDNHILLSSDKDFMQLLERNGSNLKIISPVDEKERNLDEYDGDPDFFMYVKAFRGDSGDHVLSAYPRVRLDKLRIAYNDPVAHENLMKHTFTVLASQEDGSVKEYEYLTEDLFEENQLLMNLSEQPENIRVMINETIQNAKENRGKFNFIKFLQFCGKYELTNIAQNADAYVKLLTSGKKGT
jgi:hypothetical protein